MHDGHFYNIQKELILSVKKVKKNLRAYDMLSVNQVAAQIKLTKNWKSTYDEKYTIDMKSKWEWAQEERKSLRPGSRRELEEGVKTRMAKESFVYRPEVCL